MHHQRRMLSQEATPSLSPASRLWPTTRWWKRRSNLELNHTSTFGLTYNGRMSSNAVDHCGNGGTGRIVLMYIDVIEPRPYRRIAR